MKFRFCGDGDCPDWVLAEIVATLSNLSAESLELLTNVVAKRINSGEELEEEAINKITFKGENDGKSSIACIHFILMNASRHNVTTDVLSEEIQQLGLPEDHASAICRTFSENVAAIRQKLIQRAFKINELKSIQFLPLEADDELAGDCCALSLDVSKELVNGLQQDQEHTFNIQYVNLKSLLNELKHAKRILEEYKLTDEELDNSGNN